MKKIIILSFMYESNLILKEFELLKEHYNKIINYFCFPMKYYGVRATEEGETRIDEKNQIIWLHTDNIKEYDKSLLLKVLDCFKFMEDNKIEYDVVIKSNTSTLLNLQQINRIIQNNNTENISFTAICRETFTVQGEMFKCFKGNFITFSKKIVNCILNEFDYSISPINKSLFYDDHYLSYFIKDKFDIWSTGMLFVTNERGIPPASTIDNIDDIFSVAAVCIKNYTNITHSDDYKDSSFDFLDNFCIDITVLKIFINYIEKNIKEYKPVISHFTF